MPATQPKAASKDLVDIQASFRAYSTSAARAAQLEGEAASRAAEDNIDVFASDDMAYSSALDGTVGATSVGRIGYRK